jgi:hypothetical protein
MLLLLQLHLLLLLMAAAKQQRPPRHRQILQAHCRRQDGRFPTVAGRGMASMRAANQQRCVQLVLLLLLGITVLLLLLIRRIENCGGAATVAQRQRIQVA